MAWPGLEAGLFCARDGAIPYSRSTANCTAWRGLQLSLKEASLAAGDWRNAAEEGLS